jgi:hypothetical protein
MVVRKHRCLLGERIRRRAPRLRRAAVRLWGLNAQRDRANKTARAGSAHL